MTHFGPYIVSSGFHLSYLTVYALQYSVSLFLVCEVSKALSGQELLRSIMPRLGLCLDSRTQDQYIKPVRQQYNSHLRCTCYSLNTISLTIAHPLATPLHLYRHADNSPKMSFLHISIAICRLGMGLQKLVRCST